MKSFLIIWVGQLVSALGSAATTFGVAVWLYSETGQIADLAMVATAAYLPHILVAPYGGVLADRLDRRLLMILGDSGSAITSVAMLACIWAGLLSPWVAVALVAISASCNALQWPAYEAAIVALVPRENLGRANGLCELSRGLSQLLAPVLAGALFVVIGLRGLVIVDLLSFVCAMLALMLVRIPAHEVPSKRNDLRSVLADLRAAWHVVAERTGLLVMLLLFAMTNFTFAVVELLLKPLVLSFGTPLDLGIVLSSAGIGMVAGSMTLAAWGGPRKKVVAILVFQLVEGGALIVGGLQADVMLISAAAFTYGFVIPLTFGCARTIWQMKIPQQLQGRVAALRNAIIMIAIPLGYAAATPLAELLESLIASESTLATSLGRWIGVGEGRGTALVVIVMGAVTCAAGVTAFCVGSYRHVETELDDLLDSCSDASDG